MLQTFRLPRTGWGRREGVAIGESAGRGRLFGRAQSRLAEAPRPAPTGNPLPLAVAGMVLGLTALRVQAVKAYDGVTNQAAGLASPVPLPSCGPWCGSAPRICARRATSGPS